MSRFADSFGHRFGVLLAELVPCSAFRPAGLPPDSQPAAPRQPSHGFPPTAKLGPPTQRQARCGRVPVGGSRAEQPVTVCSESFAQGEARTSAHRDVTTPDRNPTTSRRSSAVRAQRQPPMGRRTADIPPFARYTASHRESRRATAILGRRRAGQPVQRPAPKRPRRAAPAAADPG